jgi:hypothetical protein
MLSRPRCSFKNRLRSIERYGLPRNCFRYFFSTSSAWAISLPRYPALYKNASWITATRGLSQLLSRKDQSEPSILPRSLLPICCPGCGAYTQTVDPNEPGYYSKTGRKTRKLRNRNDAPKQSCEPLGAESSDGPGNSFCLHSSLALKPARMTIAHPSQSLTFYR